MRVLLVGDTHGNPAWLERVVFPAAERSRADLIFQLGDFGWWPRVATNDGFLRRARQCPVPLWWIDGNHEDHLSLEAAVGPFDDAASSGPCHLGGNLWYVPRGLRMEVGGVIILGCGGAHSIDRPSRTSGVDWFEQERVTDADVERCIQGGPVDVLLCHDAPAGWRIPNLPPDEALPRRWQHELPDCWGHRRQLARILDAVTPGSVVHGHYHSGYTLDHDAAWGRVRVVGLSEDATADNLALLDCVDGSW